MHRSESDQLLSCALCGGSVDPGSGRAYVFAPGSALCAECAISRDGQWDEGQDRWARAPDVSDLVDVES